MANTVRTAGYQGTRIEGFLEKLKSKGISILVDVRRNPMSRKRGFGGTALKAALEEVGIGYIHIPELGIESKLRRNLRCREDYLELLHWYRTESLPQRQEELRAIAKLVEEGSSVVLLCFEANPDICHRGIVAEEVAGIAGAVTEHI